VTIAPLYATVAGSKAGWISPAALVPCPLVELDEPAEGGQPLEGVAVAGKSGSCGSALDAGNTCRARQ